MLFLVIEFKNLKAVTFLDPVATGSKYVELVDLVFLIFFFVLSAAPNVLINQLYNGSGNSIIGRSRTTVYFPLKLFLFFLRLLFNVLYCIYRVGSSPSFNSTLTTDPPPTIAPVTFKSFPNLHLLQFSNRLYT